MEEFRRRQREEQKTPLYPSQQSRRKQSNPRQKPVIGTAHEATVGGVLRLLNGVSLWYVWRYRFEPVLSETRITEASPCRRISPGSVA